MFDDKEKAGRETEQQHAAPRRRFHVTVERVDAGQQRRGGAGIGGDQGTMRQKVGLEDDQHQGQKSGAGAKHLLRHQEREQRRQQRKKGSAHPGPEDHLLVIIPKNKIAPAEVRLGLEIAVLQLRLAKVHGQQGNRRNHLHQWRVLGVQPEIVMLQRHESGEDVIALIEAERLVFDGVQQLAFEHQEQEHDRGDLDPRSLQQGT